MEAANAGIKSTTLASPKINKLRTPTASSSVSNVSFGCEHIQALLGDDRKQTIQQYIVLQGAIRGQYGTIHNGSILKRVDDGRTIKTLTPNFFCLHCSAVGTSELRQKHSEAEGHGFSVESQSGCLYCNHCQDFVYDPTMEEVRICKNRRKHKPANEPMPEDAKLVAANSTFVPCRAVGLRGLYNMGQTCFMSAVLQCLIHNPFLRAFYLSEGHKPADCEKESCTSCAMDEILTEFHSAEKAEGYGAVSMLLGSWMGAQALAGYQQQDAHEYMQFILNSLHVENGGSPDQNASDCSCIIHKTFYGQLQSAVTCDKCRNVTTTVEPIMDLSLDLRTQAKRRKVEAGVTQAQDTTIDLKDALRSFTRKERLSSADYTCHNCGGTQQNAAKQLSIRRMPPVLPIHLKRFEHSKSNSSKLETKVTFPLLLDMYPYTSKQKQDSNSSVNTLYWYELFSVIVHRGKMDSGHYISYSREGADWFQFDDSKVVKVSEAEVLDTNAYLLFYIAQCIDM